MLSGRAIPRSAFALDFKEIQEALVDEQGYGSHHCSLKQYFLWGQESVEKHCSAFPIDLFHKTPHHLFTCKAAFVCLEVVC